MRELEKRIVTATVCSVELSLDVRFKEAAITSVAKAVEVPGRPLNKLSNVMLKYWRV